MKRCALFASECLCRCGVVPWRIRGKADDCWHCPARI